MAILAGASGDGLRVVIGSSLLRSNLASMLLLQILTWSFLPSCHGTACRSSVQHDC